MSYLAWLDYSTRDQRRVLDTIRLFSEPGTVDEIGVGTVRDALADLLFPGTSTIQTRAKYFLFIPWIYRRHEERETSSADIEKAARKDEVALIDALVSSDDTEGVIGKLSRASLQRLPSAVYWQGLVAWRIRLLDASQYQYHRSLDHYYRLRREPRERAEGEAPSAPRQNWQPALPAVPDDFPKKASLRLTRTEAVFLQERIFAGASGTLLAFLADRSLETDSTRFAWEHPLVGELPQGLKELVAHARCFSEVIHGAALVYNLLLAELKGDSEQVKGYSGQLANWAAGIEGRRAVLEAWDRARFWDLVAKKNPSIPPGARAFIDSWSVLTLTRGVPSSIASNEKARKLVQERERFLKKGLARVDNRRALDLWQGDSMLAQLDFRWYVTQRILKDIFAGLRNG
jgi:hypothetical protein